MSDTPYEDALAQPGNEDRLPLVLIERAILQAWNEGQPFIVLPDEHTHAAAMQGREPVMPGGVCGARHYDTALAVEYVCMLPNAETNPGHAHGWARAVHVARTPY